MGRRWWRATALIEPATSTFTIVRDDATGPAITALIALHLAEARSGTAAAYRFALGLDALRAPDVTLWSLWRGQALLGCAALKDLGGGEGEVKSMRTHPDHLRKGVAARLLSHLVVEARGRGWHRLNLETGTSPSYAPAQALYRHCGFVERGPYADYVASPYNRFMTLALASQG